MSKNFSNFLVWSEQRAKSIQSCPSQYAFRYIQAWGGWDFDAPRDKQQAYHLNSVIADLRMATGNIVHDRVGRIVRRLASGMEVDPAVEIFVAEEDFDRFIADSEKLSLSQLGGKKKKLLCHLLGKALPDSYVAMEREGISKMLRHFFALPEVTAFQGNPSCVLRDFVEAELGPPTYELGVPARLMTDAVFVQDGITVVCDWKTGKPDNPSNPVEPHRDKGTIYDLFVRCRLGLSLGDRVQVRFLYLRSGESIEFEYTDEERQEALWRVGEEFELIRERSLHPTLNIANPESFAARPDYHCLSCAHQVMCPSFAIARARGVFNKFNKSDVLS